MLAKLLKKLDCTRAFTAVANVISRLAGRPLTFALCVALILAWAVSGPMFRFSDTWQLVINTSTTIVTFLMVFLIQNTQNRDNAALQAKLDELIRVTNAKNGFIGIEKLTDRELEKILASFEDDDDDTPLGEKSAILDSKAKEVRSRRSRSTAAKRKAAPRRKAS